MDPFSMMVMGAISAAGSIGSGLIGASAADRASQKQLEFQQQGLAEQKAEFAQGQANIKPWIDTGSAAAYSQASLYGMNTPGNPQTGGPNWQQFLNTPDYQWARDQGNMATTNLLSAQGNLLSGSGLTSLTNFGQGLASQQFGNYFNRLNAMSQTGANVASNSLNAATAQGNAIGANYNNQGATAASGIVGSANALSQGITGAGNNLLLASMMRGRNPSGYQNNPAGGQGGGGLSDGTVGPPMQLASNDFGTYTGAGLY